MSVRSRSSHLEVHIDTIVEDHDHHQREEELDRGGQQGEPAARQ